MLVVSSWKLHSSEHNIGHCTLAEFIQASEYSQFWRLFDLLAVINFDWMNEIYRYVILLTDWIAIKWMENESNEYSKLEIKERTTNSPVALETVDHLFIFLSFFFYI